MKKPIFLFSAIVLLALLAGCKTTVSINTLSPSEIDLGGKQVIAVAPVEQNLRYRRYKTIPVYTDDGVPVPTALKGLSSIGNSGMVDDVSAYLGQSLYRSLSDGVYKIISPEQTNRYLKGSSLLRSQGEVLYANGVTLLLESSIDEMNFDEYITGRAYKTSDGKVYYNYYLCKQVELSFSYKLRNVLTGKTVDSYSYSGEYPRRIEDSEILIAQLDVNGNLSFVEDWNDRGYDYRNLIDKCTSQIRNRLIPHAVKLTFNLQDGSSKEFEEINKLVSDGYLNIALDQYLNIYRTTGNTVAGYNSAVLYYGLGNPEEAILLARSIYKNTLDSETGKLLAKMEKVYASNLEAKEQAGF